MIDMSTIDYNNFSVQPWIKEKRNPAGGELEAWKEMASKNAWSQAGQDFSWAKAGESPTATGLESWNKYLAEYTKKPVPWQIQSPAAAENQFDWTNYYNPQINTISALSGDWYNPQNYDWLNSLLGYQSYGEQFNPWDYWSPFW